MIIKGRRVDSEWKLPKTEDRRNQWECIKTCREHHSLLVAKKTTIARELVSSSLLFTLRVRRNVDLTKRGGSPIESQHFFSSYTSRSQTAHFETRGVFENFRGIRKRRHSTAYHTSVQYSFVYPIYQIWENIYMLILFKEMSFIQLSHLSKTSRKSMNDSRSFTQDGVSWWALARNVGESCARLRLTWNL